MRRILGALLSVIVLGCLPLAGCGVSATPSPAATSEITTGGVLNLYGTDPITLDPAIAGDMTSHEYIAQIFSGLVCLDADLEPAPDIAREWQVSPDGCTYTFELREDACFHDGRPVTAADFKYAWERACDPSTGSRVAATYLGDIAGAGDVLAGLATEISGVTVVDDFTLRVTIDAPKSYFLAKLTYPTAYVVDRNNVAEGDEWWRQPNGTGAFRLEEWQESDLLVLERNELYYGEMAKVDRVVFYLWGGVPMIMYETGEIDAAAVSVGYIDRVTDPAGPFCDQLAEAPELSFSYIGFNAAAPPFNDAAVRRAFTMAVDKQKLVSLVFRDMVQPAAGILPPGIPGYNENLAGLPYDPAAARALLDGSSYGGASGLPPVTLTVSGWGGAISSDLEALIQQWRENLGVEVTVRQLEPQHYLYHLVEEKDEMYYMGWVADYPHPQDFLDILFHTGSENNFSEYSNLEVDDLLDSAAVNTDAEASLELYQQAEQLLVEDAACLPLWFGENYYLVQPYVQGYRLNPMGVTMLDEVSLSE